MPARLLVVVIIAFVVGSFAALMLAPSGAPPLPQGKALIGGPFTLTNHEGKRVTEQDFQGKYALVVFGYTFCPDICPAELQTMANAMDELGPQAEQVTPILITIDPERDTVEQLAGYVKNFHARFVGLTGSPEDVKKAARAYRVFYAKAEDKASATDYLMDHSAFIYLMDRQGEYVTHFAYGTAPEKMAAGIAKAMADSGAR